MYDMRPDRVGWTVYDVETGRPVLLDDLDLVGLDVEVADELVALLNRWDGPTRSTSRTGLSPATSIRGIPRDGAA